MENIIYMIKCNDITITDTYIGSTNNLKKRFIKHKSSCYNVNRKSYNYKLYKFIRDNGGFENFTMIELETFITDSKEEILNKEKYYIQLYKSSLNMISPFRTKEEIKENNKEYMKKYCENNKEHRKEYMKKYRENNKEHYKKYRENNKEHYKEYRENNKEKLCEKSKRKVMCDCGCEVNIGNLSTHKKTKKHIDLMNQKN